jgi:hypothetical protein
MDANGYRRRAQRYSELAVTACDETQRNLLIQVAVRWQGLADCAEHDPYGDDLRVVLP